VVDLVCCGLSNWEVARSLGLSNAYADKLIASVGLKIPGHHNFNHRERIILWRAKQIGVAEYLAGLRDGEGFPIVERDYPATHPESVHHSLLFPEDS
jgi:DNA-binding CsgD family transcriptional regulator